MIYPQPVHAHTFPDFLLVLLPALAIMVVGLSGIVKFFLLSKVLKIRTKRLFLKILAVSFWEMIASIFTWIFFGRVSHTVDDGGFVQMVGWIIYILCIVLPNLALIKGDGETLRDAVSDRMAIVCAASLGFIYPLMVFFSYKALELL